MKKHIPFIAVGALVTAVMAQVAKVNLESEEVNVVQAPDVIWGALNPARGDKGPKAGTLWNDRTKESASGFLVRFTDGFSSPPHIHNVTYRGVVIRGLVHNDDPNAGELWMPPGSFWTQPAGEVHITAAKGEEVTAYIEIDRGPYLVLPEAEAYDEGERPINMVPSNVVWLASSQTSWIQMPSGANDRCSPEIAFLWGTPGETTTSGSFVRLPKGFDGHLHCHSGSMRVVIVEGSVVHTGSNETEPKGLQSGDYFGISGTAPVGLQCEPDEGSVAYIRASGTYRIIVSE
ncbi:MAG: DUF4437 domain-containing protein [Verrucomicrobiota bacterium]